MFHNQYNQFILMLFVIYLLLYTYATLLFILLQILRIEATCQQNWGFLRRVGAWNFMV